MTLFKFLYGVARSALLCAALVRPAAAATLDGVTFPDTMQYGGQTLVLNGVGLRTLTILEVHIYVAALYLPAPSHDPQQILQSSGPKVLTLKFLHGGSKQEVQEEYRKGERVNCADGGCSAADSPDFERLVAAAPAVSAGDTSPYEFANGGVVVLANGQEIDKVNNPSLAKRLLAGFIGDHPPSPRLRRELLGLPND